MVATSFLATAELAEQVVASAEVAATWDEASALTGYTVGGLAGHLARAVLTVPRYLESAGSSQAPMVDAAGYFATVLGDHDPVASELHAGVRSRSVAEAEEGPVALVGRMREARQQLAATLDDALLARQVQVLQGLEMTVAGYLETRLVELVIHLDDLTVSVGREPPTVPPDALACVAGVLGRTAALRAGGWATIRSLSRAERHLDAVRAF